MSIDKVKHWEYQYKNKKIVEDHLRGIKTYQIDWEQEEKFERRHKKIGKITGGYH